MANFSIWDQAVLTNLINRDVETQQEREPTIGERIAPSVDVQSREVKIEVNDMEAFGKGQFRAPGATPPLVEFAAQRREEVMELALLDEMHRIKDEDWIRLNSNDQNIRRSAGVQLVDRGNALAIRNRRLREAMRWDAFDGEAVITYPNGSQVKIDYGIPADHKPTASVLWSDLVNSDPINDIKTWSNLIADKTGHYGLRVHIATEVWEYIQQNEKVAGYLTGSDRPLLIPRQSDVLALLRDGTEIVITDAGYRDEGVGIARGVNSLTRFLPKDKVLITTPYSIDGERIADYCSGQVVVSTGYNQAAIRQGPQAETILDHISKTHFLRYASAGIVRVHQPEAFLWATVS